MTAGEEEPPAQSSYQIALVLDDACGLLDEAMAQLRRVCEPLWPSVLSSMDLYYDHPTILVCVLHLGSSGFADPLSTALRGERGHAHWRCLDLMALAPEERAGFVSHHQQRCPWRRQDVRDLDPYLEDLRDHIRRQTQARQPRRSDRLDLIVPVSFATGTSLHRALTHDISPEGLFIECDTLMSAGDVLQLSLEPDNGPEPLALNATVVYALDEEAAARVGRKPGFAAKLTLDGEEKRLLRSFLVAASRGAPWPERSGRRHERFPIRVRCDMTAEGVRCPAHTVNLSRGGAFVATFAPPAIGASLMLLFKSGLEHDGISMSGEVVHCISEERAAAEPQLVPGVGIRFTEHPDVVDAKLQRLLGMSFGPSLRRALLVDDDRFFRAVIGNVLRSAGYEIIEAQDGEQAFARLLEELLRLDVLILDLFMPGMNGADLVHKIRKLGGELELAIIVLTGAEVGAAEREGLSEIGADGVVSKREPPEVLLERIEECLQRRALERAAREA
jgi:CheY-like chemotaxis protein/Tfp pilus assembly protein PilZ